MQPDPCEYVFYQMFNTPIREYPFDHIYVENIFPAQFYQQILSHLPPTDKYASIDTMGKVSKGSYKERLVFSLIPEMIETLSKDHQKFWIDFSAWLCGDTFRRAVLHLFSESIAERFIDIEEEPQLTTVIDLIRDTTNYNLGPHTDIPEKLISLLFYLPLDDRHSHHGTSLFVPVDPSFQDTVGRHYTFDDFKTVTTMPFKPNTLFGFARQDDSWHGVLPLKEKAVERNSISYCIKIANWDKLSL